ncbi:LamG-like jellyroll fold domain-containing protein, partial [Meridianimarinicoccus roseus]|uniref:LamG-like jellyroll fold domain-containing protein n=1 Tax=Meridianimarinicoccus roseus TaxID=2072018 RepID=UPI0011B23355
MCELCSVAGCDCEALRADGTDSGPASASSISVIDVAPPTLTDVQTLDSSFRWSGNAVHYAFPDTADGFTGGQGQYSSYNEIGAMLNLSEFGKDSLREGFAQWDAVTALTIEEAAPGTMAGINVGASSIPSTAWAYYPGTQPANGDIWFNTNQWYLDALASAPEPIIGSYAYATGMHEFGHALGLKHPHQIVASGTTALAATYDAVEFSIMSYRSFPGGNIGGYTLETWGYPQSPMMLDIAMIQQMYGADYGTLAGDTTYTVSTQTGEVFVDGVSLGAPGANRVFRTLWDGNGTDHIDLSNYTTSMYADLNAGRGIKFDTIGTFQTAKLASGVYAGFNIYMSLLHGDDTRSLIENLTTGSGDDTLIGNAAVNVLSGGSGNDTFRSGLGADIVELGSGADVLIGTLAELDGDTVTDFSIAEDRIVLEDLTLGAGHFTLMSDGVLLIDDDGDGNADARITLGAGVAGAEIMVTAQDSSTLVTLQQPSVDPDPEPDPDPVPVGTELVRIDFDGGVAQDSASATQLSYSQDGLGVAGETAEGFRLTGSTKIVLDRFAPHLQNLDAFTIEMSLKRDAGSAGNFLDSHTTLDAVVGADGALSFRIATTDGVFALTTDPGLVTSGVWHKIAMSYDASQSLLQLYVDDVLGAETAATGTLTGLGTYPLVIGNTWSSSLKGDIDNFVILDAAQT